MILSFVEKFSESCSLFDEFVTRENSNPCLCFPTTASMSAIEQGCWRQAEEGQAEEPALLNFLYEH